MKFERNNKYTTVAVYAFIVIAAAIAFYFLLAQLGLVIGWAARIFGFVTPVIYGLAFAYLLDPLVQIFENRLFPRLFKWMKPKLRRGLSILFTCIIALVVITLFLALVLPQLISSLIVIGSNVPSYLKSMQTLYYRILDSIAGLQVMEDSQSAQIIQVVLSYVMRFFEDALESLGSWLTRDLLNIVIAGATKFTGGVLNIFIGAIVSIYFLAEKGKLLAQVRKAGNAAFSDRVMKLLGDIAMDCHKVLSGYVLGKLIDSMIIGILCFIGMSIMGFPYAMLISVILGISNIIPYFGPILGCIPGFLLIFISDMEKGPIQALLFLVFILILQQLDGNVLEPKILGDTVGLPALWIIFSIMLFSGLMGIPGMFIGVPLFAMIYHLASRLVTFILGKKGKPLDTGDYYTDGEGLPVTVQKDIEES